MDDILDIFKRHYNNIVLLLDAEKSLDQAQNEHVMAIEELEQHLEQYTQRQADGWKIKTVKDISGSTVKCFQAFCDFLIKKCNQIIF